MLRVESLGFYIQVGTISKRLPSVRAPYIVLVQYSPKPDSGSLRLLCYGLGLRISVEFGLVGLRVDSWFRG